MDEPSLLHPATSLISIHSYRSRGSSSREAIRTEGTPPGYLWLLDKRVCPGLRAPGETYLDPERDKLRSRNRGTKTGNHVVIYDQGYHQHRPAGFRWMSIDRRVVMRTILTLEQRDVAQSTPHVRWSSVSRLSVIPRILRDARPDVRQTSGIRGMLALFLGDDPWRANRSDRGDQARVVVSGRGTAELARDLDQSLLWTLSLSAKDSSLPAR